MQVIRHKRYERMNRIVNTLLLEQRGVSSSLDEYISGIDEAIHEDFGDAVMPYIRKYPDRECMTIDTCNYDIIAFSMTFALRIKWFIYDNYITYRERHDCGKEVFSMNGLHNGGSEKSMTISVIVVNGSILEDDIKPKIRHELKHLYQCYVRDGSLVNKDKEYYNKRDLINSPDEIHKAYGMCVYLSNPIEQEAYVSELYQSLVSSKEPYSVILERSNTWRLYLLMRKYIKKLSDNVGSESFAQIARRYNINNPSAVIRNFTRSADSFLRRIGRVLELRDCVKPNKLHNT